MYFDSGFWSTYFVKSFVGQIEFFCKTFESRVMPTFLDAGSEADVIADETYERLSGLSPREDGPRLDDAQVAEAAFEAGLDHYLMVEAVRQTLANLAAVAMYHMLEQQLLYFHRRQVLHPCEEYGPTVNAHLGELHRRLSSAGVALTELPSWKTIDELKLVANVVKHGDGESARKLRLMRLELFRLPSARGSDSLLPSGHALEPLAGRDVYVTSADLQRYGSALREFWHELGNALVQAERRGSVC